MKIYLRRRHALLVQDGAFSHKIDCVKMLSEILKGIQIALLVQELWQFAEWVDFAYWWSCIGKGLRLQCAEQVFFSQNFLVFSPPI